MEKLQIKKFSKASKSVTRTIRISGKNEISFNCVINQIIEFGLKNIETK